MLGLVLCVPLAAGASPWLRLSSETALREGAPLLRFPVSLEVRQGRGPGWVLLEKGKELARGESIEGAHAALRRLGLRSWQQGDPGAPKAFAAWQRLFTVESNIMNVIGAHHAEILREMAQKPVLDHAAHLAQHPLKLPPAWLATAGAEAASALEAYFQEGFPWVQAPAGLVTGGFIQGHILGAGLEALLPGMADVWRRHARQLEDAVAQCPQNPNLWQYWYRASLTDPGSVRRLLQALPRPEAGEPRTWPRTELQGLGCLVAAARRAQEWRLLAEYLEGLAEAHRRAPGVFQGRASTGDPDNPFAGPASQGDAAWGWVGGPRLEGLLRLGSHAAASELVLGWAEVAPPWVARAISLAEGLGRQDLAQAWAAWPARREDPARAPGAPPRVPSLWVASGPLPAELEAWAVRAGLTLYHVPASRLEALGRPGEQWLALDALGARVQGSTAAPTVSDWDALLAAHPGMDLRAQALRHRKASGNAVWALQMELDLGGMAEPGREALAEAYLARRGWLLARPRSFPWIPPRGQASEAFLGVAQRTLSGVEQALLEDPSNGTSWELWSALARHVSPADPSRLLKEVGLDPPTDPLALESLAQWAQAPEQARHLLPAARNAWDVLVQDLRSRQAPAVPLAAERSGEPGRRTHQGQPGPTSFDWRRAGLPLMRLRMLLGEPEAALDLAKVWLDLGGDPQVLRAAQELAQALSAKALGQALQDLVPAPAPKPARQALEGKRSWP